MKQDIFELSWIFLACAYLANEHARFAIHRIKTQTGANW